MSSEKNLDTLRKQIADNTLDITTVKPNPIIQFKLWFDDAVKAEVDEPTAMGLATATKDGKPSSRTVLLKELNSKGFVFYTNYQSRKALQIDENPYVALSFFWYPLQRQVLIEGVLEKIEAETSDAYFKTRPRGSQIGAWASPQSTAIANRDILEKRFDNLELKYKDEDVPRPAQWGGYLVVPFHMEFWQGRENRLHDRIVYDLEKDGNWSIVRLAP